MAKIKEFYEFDIPEWAICPLLYGTYDCLSGGDIKSLKSFLEDIPIKGSWDFKEDSCFTSHNDIDTFGGNTVTAVYTVFE